MAQIPGQSSETIIGSDASFKGEISFEGSLRIDGKFDGKMNSKGRLSIGKGALVSGEMTVSTASIDGTLRGNVTATERVELAASAQVTGDVRAPRLVVAEGATLVGNCVITPDALKHDANRGAAECEQILGVTPAAAQSARR